MKNKSIWMALVNDTNNVVFARGCASKQEAEMMLVRYLRRNEGFDGNDFGDACSWIGEKYLPIDIQVFEMKARDFKDVNLQAGLLIDPPPKEHGKEKLYRVVYIIDVNAADPKGAAEFTDKIMICPDSLSPVLHIIDENGKSVEIDLSKED